jgi:hypothetical protein
MYWLRPIVLAALLFFTQQGLLSQAGTPRTLAVVAAHADDQGPVAPILARYARRGSAGAADLQASARGMACHKTQFTIEVVQRVYGAAARTWNGAIPLIPAFSTPPLTDLFR